jgi:1,4-alpha-glucan branching enzyme
MASDWQFCISTGGAKDYSEVRLRNHYGNFKALADLTRRAGSGTSLTTGDWKNIAECEARDSIFPEINPHWFAQVENPAIE